ncbi:unnamed protein product [Sphagnum tenellum]
MQASIATQQARAKGQGSCSMSDVAGEPSEALNEKMLQVNKPRSYVIPAVCDRRKDLATLVLTRDAEVELDCDNRKLRTLHLPADNYEIPKACGISTGGRSLYRVDMDDVAHRLFNISIITDLEDKFSKEFIDKILPEDDRFTYLLVLIGAISVAVVSQLP